MSVAIKAEYISKAYQLGEFSTGTLSRDVERWWAKFRGKEDPYLKIGETNDRTKKGSSDIVWSLKDISFEINKGDAVGIIGRNGAGKSTLLKVLSRVTSPTKGTIKISGRIASLLEVGTGFHPELTGRENIFLNGAILGMRKREIQRKFDEIVDFSGVERYIDTPVKRYSSGMYVRLAFAVAAHLENEILVVDEVLAVGDAEFQKKCLGKMGNVSKEDGRTVLFVSHNMAAVKELCNSAIFLVNGQVDKSGNVNEIVDYYLKSQHKSFSKKTFKPDFSYFEDVFFTNLNGDRINSSKIDDKVFINFQLKIVQENVNFGFTLYSQDNVPIISSIILDSFDRLPVGNHLFKIEIASLLLKSGEYTVEGAVWDNTRMMDQNDCLAYLTLFKETKMEKKGIDYKGILINPYQWSIIY